MRLGEETDHAYERWDKCRGQQALEEGETLLPARNSRALGANADVQAPNAHKGNSVALKKGMRC